jgi:hypothetical protein
MKYLKNNSSQKSIFALKSIIFPIKKNLVSRSEISVFRDRDPEIQKLTEMYEAEIPRRARSESIVANLFTNKTEVKQLIKKAVDF